ncbi:MAG: MurR/RpiR family transcriptional regulator [Pseudomonadota bacterium]|nr:MurR/RpiR family transcriptional regulator [Pseudomonadota bacterium]
MSKPHRDFESLRQEIVARLPRLSRRLQQVARFALEHPNDIALQNIAMIASRVGVPPSTIIRFAKALDYRGFSDMQAVFRLPLSDGLAGSRDRPDWTPDAADGPAAVLAELLDACTAAVEQLKRDVPPERLAQAVDLLAGSRTVYVVGQQGAFAAAAFLGYALTHLERPVRVLDGAGDMLLKQAGGIADGDVLVAVSFAPYSVEMAELAARVAAAGAAVIAITDSLLDPFAGVATVHLPVHERRVRSLPSLAATVCLIQALVINVGLRLRDKQRDLKPCRPRPLEDYIPSRHYGGL